MHVLEGKSEQCLVCIKTRLQHDEQELKGKTVTVVMRHTCNVQYRESNAALSQWRWAVSMAVLC